MNPDQNRQPMQETDRAYNQQAAPSSPPRVDVVIKVKGARGAGKTTVLNYLLSNLRWDWHVQAREVDGPESVRIMTWPEDDLRRMEQNKKESIQREMDTIARQRSQILELMTDVARYRSALLLIQEYKEPYKGFSFDQGSNGMRDYFRAIATNALNAFRG